MKNYSYFWLLCIIFTRDGSCLKEGAFMKKKSDEKGNDSNNNGKKKSGLNIHDFIFKHMMSVKSNVVSLVKNYVSEDTLEDLDLNTLKQLSNIIPNDNLSENQADAMYEVEYNNGNEGKGRALVYVLAEHKSFLDKHTVFQVFSYLAKIWYNESKKKGFEGITYIIPIILYHGNRSFPDDYKSLDASFVKVENKKFEESLKKYSPRFNPIIIDLSEENITTINGCAEYRLTMISMKYSYGDTDKYYKDFNLILKDIEMVNRDDSFVSYIRVVIYYAYRVRYGCPDEQEKILELTRSIYNPMENKTMTLEEFIANQTEEEFLDEVYNNGYERGIDIGQKQGFDVGQKQGRLDGMLELARGMRDKGLDFEVISELTGLSKEEIENL